MTKKKTEPETDKYTDEDKYTNWEYDGEPHPTQKDIALADGLIDHIKNARPAYFPKDGTPLDSVPLKRLCDYLSIEIYPRGVDSMECTDVYERRIKAASYEEILALWKYIRAMVRKFPIYEFSQLLTVLSIRARPDRGDILKRISQEPGFKRLITQKTRDIIGQNSQK